MVMTVNLPDVNMEEDEVRLLLAIKLFEDGIFSLGKSSKLAGYSEKAFSEVLSHRGVAPIRYFDLDLEKELNNV